MLQAELPKRAAVLVVEDEAMLRLMAVDVVEDAGFEALEACDADEAMTILERRPDIRILFTDIRMPGSMDGLSLARTVKDRWPPVKIVLTSGHCSEGDVDAALESLFFAKPYDIGRVGTALRALVH